MWSVVDKAMACTAGAMSMRPSQAQHMDLCELVFWRSRLF